MMLNQVVEDEIREKKRKGTLNSQLMREYNLRYWQLREILDRNQTMRLFDVTKKELEAENGSN